MAARNINLLAAAFALAFAGVACKINKDANCLNPKAACYKKDTEAPSVTNTNKPSSVTGDTAAVDTLSDLVLTFSEPMLNAGDKKNYPNPTGSGVGQLTISSITKISDLSYQINLTGTLDFGPIVFDLSALTDLSGNRLTNTTVTLQGGVVNLSPTYVGTGGYTFTTAKWKNQNSVTVNFQFKKGGDSCAVGSVDITSGTALSGVNVPVYAGIPANEQTATINLSEITSNPTVVRICMTNAGAGLNTELFFNVRRDDTGPTTTPSQANNANFLFQGSVSLSCTDNADRIAYTIDGPSPVIAIGPPISITTGSQYDNATGVVLPVPSVLAERSRVVRFACVDAAGHVETVQTFTYKAKLHWAPLASGSVNWDWAHWE